MSELTHTELLHVAMFEAAALIVEAVGIPVDREDLDCPDRVGALVDRDQVPALAWNAAIAAVKFLAVGIGTTSPDAPAPPEQDADVEFGPLLERAAADVARGGDVA